MSPVLITAAATALPEIIKLAKGMYEAYNNGTLTQEELDAKWAEMQGHVNAAETKWQAAGDA